MITRAALSVRTRGRGREERRREDARRAAEKELHPSERRNAAIAAWEEEGEEAGSVERGKEEEKTY